MCSLAVCSLIDRSSIPALPASTLLSLLCRCSSRASPHRSHNTRMAAAQPAGSVASLTDAAKRWKLAPTGQRTREASRKDGSATSKQEREKGGKGAR